METLPALRIETDTMRGRFDANRGHVVFVAAYVSGKDANYKNRVQSVWSERGALTWKSIKPAQCSKGQCNSAGSDMTTRGG